MAQPQAPLARPLVGFVCLVLVHCFILVTACPEADFGQLLNEFCLTKFKLEMDEIDKNLWCDWGQTVKSYREVTNCTYLVAQKLDCYWPGPQVNDFFITIHRNYFHDCPATGRVPKDPPSNVLCPFIIAPILVTLLGTALVVYKSQRNEGIV
ncbi:receptor activity-modifying protein 1 isoform X1 [Monodelphis domestica]|uniref:Receptor activity-modifying protein 1 n=1 Tax=Monodelphis domestica TaxID=13616 RepID=A0A5F8H2K0_MONDO|nr:receptor activity-modifying protein 1 isoform X1 [Monodelphis domestica]